MFQANQPSAAQVVNPQIVIQEEERERFGISQPQSGKQQGFVVGGFGARAGKDMDGDSVDRYKRQLSEQAAMNAPPVDVSTGGRGMRVRGPQVQTPGNAPAGIANPVEIESLGSLDTLILRGKSEDVKKVKEIIDRQMRVTEGVQAADFADGTASMAARWNINTLDAGGLAPAPRAAGLASLDFQLPDQGDSYYFTTPRGEVELTARLVSGDLLRRLMEIAAVAVAALAVWFIAAVAARGGCAWLTGRAGSTVLICLGLLSFVCGVFWVVGLAAVVVGCWAKIRRYACKITPAQA